MSSGTQGSSGNYAVDNLTYDLITIIHEKSKGLEAYDKYLRDAQGQAEVSQLLQRLQQQDQQAVQQLTQHLGQRLQQSGASAKSVGESTRMSGSSGEGSSA